MTFTADEIRSSNAESACMPAICSGWNMRAAALELPKKGAKRESDREAYMQGALAALVAAGLLSLERADQIAFLTAVGRLPGYMDAKASQYHVIDGSAA